ncbi:hypothetical protein SDC9_75011 [bioreactor metagenome]|uniref:Uncharacterized protein n=1 Tax=bioreactor metagenome TaxID=1076179 RepID=A0A644YIR9_9ZZZZ
MGGDDELVAQQPLEGGGDTHVGGHAPLKQDGALQPPALGQIVEVIAGQGLAQAGDDVLAGVAALLLVDHVRFGKHGAPPGNAHRVFGAEGVAAKFLDGNVQPGGLPVQKGAGARRADRVHGEVAHHAVLEQDDLGVLPADFQYGAHPGNGGAGGYGMGGNLILYHIGSDEQAGQLPPAAGGPRAADGEGALRVVLQKGQTMAQGVGGASAGFEVQLAAHRKLLIHEHQIGAHRADVHAQKIFFFQFVHLSFACENPQTSPALPGRRWAAAAGGEALRLRLRSMSRKASTLVT